MVDFNKKIKSSDKFRQSALTFINTGQYCSYPQGTSEFFQFWDREKDRCIDGYTTDDGDYISGYNYFYLNYCPIQRIVYKEKIVNGIKKIVKTRELLFPDFYDYDYYFFQAMQQAEEEGKHLCALKSRRKGYEQPYSELVATPNGFTKMMDIHVGDYVATAKGTYSKVLEEYEQGYKDVFKVTLDDGRQVTCGADHLWYVINAGNKLKPEVINTHDMLQNGIFKTYRGYNHYRYYLPEIKPVPYQEKQLPIHPYILGALLGDGTINRKGKSIKISTADQEIVDEFARLLGEDYELVKDNSCYNYRIKYKKRFNKEICAKYENGKFGVNPLSREITKLGLNVSCEYKFIPTEYVYSSIEQRMELVRGLMDTDGTISKDGSCMFANTSKSLVQDLAFVLRSLGIRCEINTYQKDNCKLLYRLYIRTKEPIFKLTRKLNRIKDKKINSKVAIVNIERLDYQEKCKCILIEDEDHLYLTRDYIPTHNSYKNAAMACRNYYLIPNSKTYIYASNKQYLTEDGILTKAWDYMNFIDKNTAWGKKRSVNTQMRKRAGFFTKDDYGNEVELGYKSEIIGVTLKDNPDIVRGKAGKLIIFEEAGSFSELGAAWQIARPSVEQDGVAFGTMVAFGCVCAGSRVWTAEGNCINVEDITFEDGIMGWDTYQAYPQNISNINPPSEKPCLRITTNSGRSIECSIDHPLLWSTPGKTKRVPGKRNENQHMKSWLWHRADLCKVGDQVGIIDEIPYFGKKKMWEPRLIGWLIGDGTYGYDKTPRIANCDKNVINYILGNFDTAIEKEYTTKEGKEYKEIRIKGICKQLRELGIYGQTKDKKRLPLDIHTYDRYTLTELIGGLFDTDGYIRVDKDGRVRIILTQCQKEMLLQVQEVLLHFGIHCSVRHIKSDNREHYSNGRLIKSKNGEWRLEINDITSVSKFADNIELRVDYKQSALDLIYLFAQNHLAKYHKYVSGIHAERIIKIEDIGVQKIYNLTANEQHNYIVNGIVTHNTGGDTDSHFETLKDMFYNPEGYNCLEFDNIWDESATTKKCGFFIPQYTNLDFRDKEGHRIYMDDDGNTLHKKSLEFILEERRKVIENATNSNTIDRYVAEHCITPSEACLEFNGNIFPKKELQEQLALLRTNKNLKNYKQVGDLTWEPDGSLRWTIKKSGDITHYPLKKEDNPEGSIVIWEHPNKEASAGLYIAGIDSYDYDESSTTSLGSCIIYKRVQSIEQYSDIIVAEYTGRPKTADEFYENVRKLLIYYNARAMYENQNKGIFVYFTNKHCDYLLADQPDIINDIVNNSKVQRKKGCHMNKQIKQWGWGLIKDWLNDINADGKKNLYNILSEPLLEELIAANDVNNVDRVMALTQVMIYREQLYNVKVKEVKKENKNRVLFEGPIFTQSWFRDDDTDDLKAYMF